MNFKIVQNPDLTLILHEEFNHFRQVHTDGRMLPVDPQPAMAGLFNRQMGSKRLRGRDRRLQ